MPNPRIATLIAQRIPAGLPHPGDGKDQKPAMLNLPAFRSTGLPPGMEAHFAKEAGLPSNDIPRLIAEAVVNLIETDGDSEIISKAELTELRAKAATLDGQTPQQITVHCRCDNQLKNPLVVLAAQPGDHWTVNGKLLLQGLANRTTECPHEPR